ncbi:ML4, partial [Symbiodinium microadriaticum]
MAFALAFLDPDAAPSEEDRAIAEEIQRQGDVPLASLADLKGRVKQRPDLFAITAEKVSFAPVSIEAAPPAAEEAKSQPLEEEKSAAGSPVSDSFDGPPTTKKGFNKLRRTELEDLQEEPPGSLPEGAEWQRDFSSDQAWPPSSASSEAWVGHWQGSPSLSDPGGATTFMLRNIPNKYTREMLVDRFNEEFRGRYDFLYVPIDFKNKCNVGYCFVNFRSQADAAEFVAKFDGVDVKKCLPGWNSKKVAAVKPARLQGVEENVRSIQFGNVMKQLVLHPEWMPLLFDDEGEVLPFPQSTPPMQPVKVRQTGAVTSAAGDASLQPLDFDLRNRWPRSSAAEDTQGFGRCNSLRRHKHLCSLQQLLDKLPSRILGGMPLEQFEQLLHGMQVQQLVLQNGHAIHVARGSGGISPARLPHVPLTQQDLSEVAAAFALPSADLCASAMRAVEGSLHRVSVGYSARKQIDSISLHVGRLLPGISAAVQKQLTSGSSIFLGPTCSGKTTVLRDAAASLSLSSSVMVVDFLGELHQGGLGLARHIVNVDAANPADFIGQVIQ